MFHRLLRLEDPVFKRGEIPYDKGHWKFIHILETCLGNWPFHRGFNIIILRMMNYISIFMIQVPMGLRVIEEIGHDWTIVLENMVAIMYLMTAVVKFATAHYYIHKRKLLYKQIKDSYTTQLDNDEFEIVNSHEYYGCKIATMYMASVIFAVSTFNSMPLILPLINDLLLQNSKLNVTTSRKVLPYPAEYFIDQEKYFYWLITKDLISASFGLISVYGHDIEYIVSVYHICGLFAVVINRLEKASSIGSKTNDKSVSYVVSAIKLHSATIHSVDIVEDCYCQCWFLVLLLNMILLGSGLCVVSMKLDSASEFFRYTLIFFSILIHFYIIFAPGQQIINTSLAIFDSCYDCEWHKLSRKSVTLLQVMMLRSIKACSLTGGKMFTLCMETYSSMMKTGFSYFTVFST